MPYVGNAEKIISLKNLESVEKVDHADGTRTINVTYEGLVSPRRYDFTDEVSRNEVWDLLRAATVGKQRDAATAEEESGKGEEAEAGKRPSGRPTKG
jgi:hypothetical protein